MEPRMEPRMRPKRIGVPGPRTEKIKNSKKIQMKSQSTPTRRHRNLVFKLVETVPGENCVYKIYEAKLPPKRARNQPLYIPRQTECVKCGKINDAHAKEVYTGLYKGKMLCGLCYFITFFHNRKNSNTGSGLEDKSITVGDIVVQAETAQTIDYKLEAPKSPETVAIVKEESITVGDIVVQAETAQTIDYKLEAPKSPETVAIVKEEAVTAQTIDYKLVKEESVSNGIRRSSRKKQPVKRFCVCCNT